MSYIKPGFVIKDGEPCNPQQINEDVLPVTQELTGHVIDHNIVADTFPQSRVAAGAYYEVAHGGTPYYMQAASDMRIQITPADAFPLTADANAWRVPDSAEWTTVGLSGPAGTAMTVSPVTGQSVLWIIAQVQYGLAAKPYTIYPVGFLPTADPYPWMIEGSSFISAHPSLQFAIRVDGIVDEASITGLEDTCRPAPIGYLPGEPTRKDGLGARPFSIHTFSTSDTESLQVPVYPVRLQAHVPVDEGSHTVEVVVRRLPHVSGRDETFYTFGVQKDIASGKVFIPAPVYVYNRKLLAVDMHVQAPSTGAAVSISTAAVQEGDTVAAATVGTPLDALAASMNDLGDGAMGRNALRNQHLPSRVRYPAQVGLNTGSSCTVAKPGFGTLGGTWNRVDDGAGNYDETPNGPFDFTANPAFVILLGNVAVSNIRLANPFQDRRSYAWFTIQGVLASGASIGNASTEMVISNPNVLYSIDVVNDCMDPNEMDVPLFEFFDFRNAPPADIVNNFRVLGGNSYALGGLTPEVKWRKSNLLMICLAK